MTGLSESDSADPAALAGARASHERAAAKLARLARIKRLATGLLVAMLALMLISTWLAPRYPWLHWVRAFAEAAAVGALADWYAVVALFGRPLGLAMPHTAIIAARKDDIGRGLGEFVESNFLTPENVAAHLSQHNATLLAAQWLEKRENSAQLAASAAEFVPALLDSTQDEDLAAFVERVFTPQLQRLDIARLSGNVLELLTAGGRHQALLDRTIEALDGWLTRHESLIRERFGQASRYTPKLVDRFIVRKLVAATVGLIHEVAQSPDHELRAQFDTALSELIVELRNSPEYREQGRLLLADLIEHLRAERYYRVVWADLRARAVADLARGDQSALRNAATDALVFLGRELQGDAAVQQKLNAAFMMLLRSFVRRWRSQVSGLISDVVRRWDARDLSARVELEIGKDLQFIRINGALVGGLAGLALHALVVWLAPG